MTAPTHTEKGRGRPRSFDEDEVLDALVALFWERGFEAASLNEIVDTSGLNKSSLYNTFGSKDELFERVLTRYMDIREATFNEAMAEGTLDALLGFVDLMRVEVEGENGGRGCLAINSSTELGLRSDSVTELSNRYRTMMRDGLRGPLERAEQAGEIDSGMARVYADVLMSFAMSTAVTVRSGAGDNEISALFDSMESLIESWRIPAVVG